MEAVNAGVDGGWDALGGGLPDGFIVHCGVVIPCFSFKVLVNNQQNIFRKTALSKQSKSLSMVVHSVVKHSVGINLRFNLRNSWLALGIIFPGVRSWKARLD